MMQEQNTIPGKTTGLVAYMTMIGAIIAIFMNLEPKNDFARFHIRQAFGLHLMFHAFALFSSVWYSQYALYGLYLCYVVLWVYGFLGAINNKKQVVPIVGPYFQKWFTFIQ
ncbi:hypothetical protein ACOCEA_14460 [Maribacter sp. CXY002]|uniref:hypothetical protein n=1 Tax=Maribacter luteocoastalis TaxID=3407671 RepID=UPI003B67AD7C